MRTIFPSPEVIHGHRPPVPVARKTSCEPIFSTQTANSLAMIIITRPDATEEQIQHIVSRVADWGLRAEVSRGEMRVVNWRDRSGRQDPTETAGGVSGCGIGHAGLEAI